MNKGGGKVRNLFLAFVVISLFVGTGLVSAAHHPVGIVSVISPEGLPLDRQNRITCNTCHDFRGNSADPNKLRKPVPDLCMSCHG
jgi:predicted CXXCH cytochrome family protein